MASAQIGLGSVLLLAACSSEPDDLDRDVVNDLSREVGDALGWERSGRYDVVVSAEQCDCLTMGIGGALSPCASLLGTGDTQLDALETDGVLLARIGANPLTGPIDADGTFALGGVTSQDSALAEGTVIVRADGSFEQGAGGWEVAGTVRGRVVATTTLEGDVVDCIDTFEFEGIAR